MINQNVENSLQSLNSLAEGNANETDLTRGLVELQSQLGAYQGSLKQPKPRQIVEYDIGASYNSAESRWKYGMLETLAAGNGVAMERGKSDSKTVHLSGDPYVIEVTLKAYEPTREWLRRMTRTQLAEATKAGQVENNYAWYMKFREDTIKRMGERLPSQIGAEKVAANTPAKATKGVTEPTILHMVVEVGGALFDLVPHKVA